jgi:hypothetical protein
MTENARCLAVPGVFFQSEKAAGLPCVGQFVDEPIQFIFGDTHTSLTETNEAQAPLVYQLVKTSVPNTNSPRCLLRTKDAPRHGDLRQIAAIECDRARPSTKIGNGMIERLQSLTSGG